MLEQRRFRIVWDDLGSFPPQVVPVLFPPAVPLVTDPQLREGYPCLLTIPYSTSFDGWLRHFMAVRHGKEAVRIHPFSGANLGE
jgi:hypothetical protein